MTLLLLRCRVNHMTGIKTSTLRLTGLTIGRFVDQLNLNCCQAINLMF